MLDNALPMPEFQNVIRSLGRPAGRAGKMWQCTQRAGEAVFVPGKFLHTTMNLGERGARWPPRSAQAEDKDPPRGGFAALAAGLGGEGGVDLGALLADARVEGHGRSIREPRRVLATINTGIYTCLPQ